MGLNPKRFLVLGVPRSDYASGFARDDLTAVRGPMLESEAETVAKQYVDFDARSGRDDLNLVVEIKAIHESIKTVSRREP
jgi:hypothetical protein